MNTNNEGEGSSEQIQPPSWTAYVRQGAQQNFDRASDRAKSDIEAMKTDFQNLSVAYDNLLNAYKASLEEKKAIKAEHERDLEKWKLFRQWWLGEISRKRKEPHKTPSHSKENDRHETGTPKPSNTFSRVKDLESKILSDVGLSPSILLDNNEGITCLPTPSHTFMKSYSSSPAEDRLKRSEKSIKRSRLSSEFTPNPSSHRLVHDRTSSPSSVDNQTNQRKPLEETLNSDKNLGSSLCSKSTRNQPDKSTEKPKTINQEFEINPEMNGNLSYLHKDVVRSKDKRKQMHANDCECCRGYYDAVGPVAVRPFEDVKRGKGLSNGDEEKGERRKNGENDQTDKENKVLQDNRQEHLQRTSRHRDYGPPPSTPPVYWNISFPTTQQVSEVNRSADAADRKRREEIARDPRFRRRLD